MDNLEKKLISEFMNLGCSQRNAAATFQIYIELSQVRRMFNVNYHYNNDLQRMYLTAKDTKSSAISVFVPYCMSENVSFDILEKIFCSANQTSVYLVIISADSTTVYYEITNKLVEINTASHIVTNLEKRQKHDSDLNNSRTEIPDSLKKEK